MYDKPYNNENSFGDTYGEHREALEFGWDEYSELKDYAKELGVHFFATAFDFASADFLAKLDMPAYKIASGDLKNIPLLKHVASFSKPMFLSTGGGNMEDVHPRLRRHHADQHRSSASCNARPAIRPPSRQLNLRVVTTFRERFPDAVIGFSSHDNGIAMATAAYVLGARVVEKHFTLNHTWKGTDHAFSLEPPGLRQARSRLRARRVALGDGDEAHHLSEKSAR